MCNKDNIFSVTCNEDNIISVIYNKDNIISVTCNKDNIISVTLVAYAVKIELFSLLYTDVSLSQTFVWHLAIISVIPCAFLLH